jgi:hypothetical protein
MLCAQIHRSVERLFGVARLVEVIESARPKVYVFEVPLSQRLRRVKAWRDHGTLHVESPSPDELPTDRPAVA